MPQAALPDPPRRPKEGPRWPKMGPRWAKKVAAYNGKILQDTFWSPLRAILGPSWVSLGSTWPFQAHLEANMASKLLSSSLQANNKTSKLSLCKFSERFLKAFCQNLDGIADHNNQVTTAPNHQPTSPRGWFGGMRGAIKSKRKALGCVCCLPAAKAAKELSPP